MTILSYSSFNTFQECPKRYWFERIQRLKRPEDTKRFIHGSLIQKVVENWYNQKKFLLPGKEPRQWLQDNLIPIYNQDPDILKDRAKAKWESPEEEDRMLENCRTMLDTFVDLVKEHRLLASDQRMEMELSCELAPSRKLTGRVDFWFPKNDGVHLLDGKATARKIPGPEQLLIYVLMAQKSRGVLPKVGFLYYKLGYVEYHEYTEQVLKDMLDRLHDTFDQIEKGNFPAKPGNPCYFCKYKGDCDDYKKMQHDKLPAQLQNRPKGQIEIDF